MKFSIIGGVAATALALSTAVGFAQSPAGAPNQPSWTNEYNPKAPQVPAIYGQDAAGGASSSKSDAGQYHQGAAEDLAPLSKMGQYQQSSETATKTKSQ
jgi:hypothetical protein